MTIKDGGTVYPCDRISTGPNELTSSIGISLRDYFAAKAMQGLLASETRAKRVEFAEYAYEMADAMIRAREVTA